MLRRLPFQPSLALGLMLLASGTAAQQSDRPSPTVPPTGTACSEPRPQICPQIYQPVCGYKANDARHTYSNACTACADKQVVGHRPGPC
ncbi:MAG: hypothetical protein KF889_16745 [Alphaproteobacteria bacterium]|nr:hypothetical protein [Alphaproteobacteria bacterium]MCW5739982.1 hypothetical protein [Alphaproteobacteria bacterium]